MTTVSDPDLTEYATPDELWARPPNKTLVSGHHLLSPHSETVATRMTATIANLPIMTVAGRETDFGWVIGYCHDFGKLSVWFQRWVRREVDTSETRRYHAGLGALLAMYALECRGFNAMAQALAFAVVHQHHAPMPDMPALVDTQGTVPTDPSKRRQITETYDRFSIQLRNIAQRVPVSAREMVEKASDGTGTLEQFRQYVDERRFVDVLSDRALRHNIHTELYADVLIAYTVLKFADSSHSAGAVETDLLEGQSLDRCCLTKHLEDFPTQTGVRGRLDELRDQAQEEVTHRVKLFDDPDTDPPCVGSIWLPTGFGKTLAGLSAALDISELLEKQGPIIYALPFTSIIDQTAEEIEDVFKVTPGSPEFIVQHHLAKEAKAIKRRSAAQPIDTSLEYLLGGAWRAGCVLTTFVQVFESLLGPRQSQATKVPALTDSVVILDEPQELPPRLWPLLARLIEILVDRFHAHVIFMTATQPKFFEMYSDHEVIDLIDDPTPYIEFLAANPRVSYRLHPSAYQYIDAADASCEDTLPLSHTDAAHEIGAALGLIGSLSEESDSGLSPQHDSIQSALAVCNTISSSQLLHETLRSVLTHHDHYIISPAIIYDDLLCCNDQTPSPKALIDALEDEIASVEQPVVVLNLTARHRPLDRRILLGTLTGTDQSHGVLDLDIPVLVTSTRLIEAGVDIGFDRVYRDMSQVVSIVQSGGRCNREFGASNGGVVTVWRLGEVEVDEDERVRAGRTPASFIYGNGASGGAGMAQTRAALRDRGSEITEAEMITVVVEAFFTAMRTYGHGDKQLVEALTHAATDAVRDVSLIEDSPHLTDALVTRTSEEQTMAATLCTELAKRRDERDQRVVEQTLATLSSIRYAVPAPLDEQSLAASSYDVCTDWLVWLATPASEYTSELGVIDR